ncbi:MAG TPA: thymidine kinase [Azospirillaceae bacterium]|nr:thymidine kinase [Azospirillaceae bacterium]
MRYGKLEVICGPMFSGKSTEILKRAVWYTHGTGTRIMLLKPAFDVRYAEDRVVNHDGVGFDATPIRTMPPVPPDVSAVFIDEVQFCCAPHFEGDIVESIRELLVQGIDVGVSGLDTDWRGRPFSITAQLAAMADSIHKLRSRCAVCGHDASKSFKKHRNDRTVELGQADLYEPRCNLHWHDHSDRKGVELSLEL